MKPKFEDRSKTNTQSRIQEENTMINPQTHSLRFDRQPDKGITISNKNNVRKGEEGDVNMGDHKQMRQYISTMMKQIKQK